MEFLNTNGRKERGQWWFKGLHWIILKVFSSCDNSMILRSAGLSIQAMEVPRTAGSHLKRKTLPWDQATENNGVCFHAGLKAAWCERKPETKKGNRGEGGDLFQTFPLLFCLTLLLKHSLFEGFLLALLVFGACLFAGDGSDRSIGLTPAPITHPH